MPGARKTFDEFKAGQLHSGSKTGPVVTSRKQAVAIALNSARKAGVPVPPPKPRRPTISDAIERKLGR